MVIPSTTLMQVTKNGSILRVKYFEENGLGDEELEISCESVGDITQAILNIFREFHGLSTGSR